MKLAIMQPYFLPYIGYFQLIENVDAFVIYDNIKYTKKGWINRNRFLLNGAAEVFSLPLKRDSDALDIAQRQLAADFNGVSLLNKLKGAYAKAAYFSETYPLLEEIVNHDDRNLFRFIRHALVRCCSQLGIATPIRTSSDIAIDHTLKGQGRVMALCRALGATTYVNAIGGLDLYSAEAFEANGIELRFLKPRTAPYPQFGGGFVPWLSIADIMMFNPIEEIRRMLAEQFDLL